MADTELLPQHQSLSIEELRSLIQNQEKTISDKNKQLEEANASLSKLRLQAKARAVKESKRTAGDSTDKQGDERAAEEGEGDIAGGGDKGHKARIIILKRKLDEKDKIIKGKDEIIAKREENLIRKDELLLEKDEEIHILQEKVQLHMMDSQGSSDVVTQQDHTSRELTNRVKELEMKLLEMQELVKEKEEVICGRDKVIEMLQGSLTDKDQSINDQLSLISKLTSKVEASDVSLTVAMTSLEQKDQLYNDEIKKIQRTFDEKLEENQMILSSLRDMVGMREAEVAVKENELREMATKHERELQNIASKGEVDLHDHVIVRLEQQINELNAVVDGRVDVINKLQKDLAEREKLYTESSSSAKSLQEKLQMTSEQMVLMQENFIEMEQQWKHDQARLQQENLAAVEKYEFELNEKDAAIRKLNVTLGEYETSYQQSVAQYDMLKAKFTHADGELDKLRSASADDSKDREVDNLREESRLLQMQLDEKSRTIEELNATYENAGKAMERTSDAKMIKMKAQMTAKIKALEKELKEQKKIGDSTDEVTSLKKRLSDVETEKMALFSQLSDVHDTNIKYEEANKNLEESAKQVERLLEELQCANTDKQKLEMINNQLQTSLSVSGQQDVLVQELHNKIQELSVELNQGQEKVIKQVEELENSRLNIVSLQEVCDKQNHEVVALKSDKMELGREIDRLKQEKSYLDLQLSEVRSTVDAYHEEISGLKAGLLEQSQMVELRENQVKLMGAELETEQKVVMERNAELLTCRSHIDALMGEVTLCKKEIASLTEVKDVQSDEVRSLTNQIVTKDEALVAMSKQLGDQISEYDVVLSQLREKSQYNELLTIRLDEQLNLTNQLTGKSDEAAVLSNQLQEVNAKNDTLIMHLKEKTDEAEQLAIQLQEVRHEKATLAEHLDALSQEQEAATALMFSRETDLKKAHNDLGDSPTMDAQ